MAWRWGLNPCADGASLRAYSGRTWPRLPWTANDRFPPFAMFCWRHDQGLLRADCVHSLTTPVGAVSARSCRWAQTHAATIDVRMRVGAREGTDRTASGLTADAAANASINSCG